MHVRLRSLSMCALLVVAAVALQTPAVGTAESNCQEIDGPAIIDSAGCYVMTASVLDHPDEYVVRIQASDVELDGNGHVLDGDGTGSAAIVVEGRSDSRRSNVVIRDFEEITDFEKTVRLAYTDDSTIENVTTRSAQTYGIALFRSNDNEIRDVTTTFNGGDDGAGIYLFESDRTSIVDSTASDNGGNGIVNDRSDGTAIVRTAANRNVNGILVRGGSSGITIRESVTNDNGRGLSLEDGIDEFVTDFRAVDHTSTGNDDWDVYHRTESSTPRNIVITDGDDTTTIHNVGMTASSLSPAPPDGYDNVTSYRRVSRLNQFVDAYYNRSWTYDDGDVSEVDESTLGLWRHDGLVWSEVASSTVDTGTNTLTANATSFGTMAVLGEVDDGSTLLENDTLEGANVSVDPDDLEYGNVTVGQATTETVTVTNDGNVSLTIDDVSVTGFDDDAFTTGAESVVLDPNESLSIDVTFEPPTTGKHSADLEIYSADLEDSTITVPLSGSGVAGNLFLGTDHLDLGATKVSTHETRTVALYNGGNGALTIESVSFEGNDPDQFRAGEESITVDPGEWGELNLTFVPTREGNASATMVVHSDDPDTSTAEVTVEGRGVRPDLAATPTGHDFGGVPLESTSETTITLANEGTGTLDLSGVTIAGPDAHAFRIVDGGDVLALDETTTHDVTVAFEPFTAGSKRARLQVRNRTGVPIYAVELEGQALAPDVEVAEESLTFADAVVGETSTKTVTVENRGDDDLTIRDQRIKPADAGFAIEESLPRTLAPGASETLTVAYTPDSPRPSSAVLSLATDDPREPTVPVFLSSTHATANVSLEETENVTRLRAAVRNASAGEELLIAVPDVPDEDDDAGVDEVWIKPTVGGEFSINVTDSDDPHETAPAFDRPTDPAGLGYVTVSHTIDNDDISQAAVTYRVAKERLAALGAGPADVTLYRYHDGEWTAVETELVAEREDAYVFRATSDGFSEWTAAAEVPRIDVADASANVTVVTTEDTVDIEVLLENTGGADGVFETKLLLNGTVVERRDVGVAAGATSLVAFRRGFDQPGTYEVRVNDEFVAAIDVSAAEREAEVAAGEATVTDGGDGGGWADNGTGRLPGPLLVVVALLCSGAGAWLYYGRRE